MKIMGKMMTLRLVLALVLLVMLSSCQSEKPGGKAETKRYSLNGEILSVDRETHRAKIKHDTIQGFMEAMTMSYKIKDDAAYPSIKPGDTITADVVVDPEDGMWLEKIVIVKKTAP